MVTTCFASTSSCTSPRARMSDSAWRTCSPTRRTRTERVSGESVFIIAPVPLPRTGGGMRSQRPFAHLDFEGFEEVARFVVGKVLRERHAALQTCADLGHIVLEAAQRRDLALVDDDILPGDARLQRLADDAFGDEQTRRLAMLARREDLADFG